MYAESQSRSEARSAAEVVDAVGRLSKHDLARLRTAARVWIGGLGLDKVTADADDLVQEAIFRTTSGQRTWKVGVDIVRHLHKVMHSIVDSWRKSAERRALSGQGEVRESDIREAEAGPEDDDVVDYTPVSNAPSPEPGTARALIGMQDIRAFEAHFAKDEVAGAVIHGMWAQMKGPEIKERWNLTEKQYRAAVRRIRRHANRIGDGRGD